MKALAAICAVTAVLTGGCLSRDVSREYASLVGREVVVLRDCYAYEGHMTTSVALSTSVPAWVLQHKDYCEQHYHFTPGSGVRAGRFDMQYVAIPAGTKLFVEAVRADSFIDSGSETFATGTMIHPVSKKRVRWMYSFWAERNAPWEAKEQSGSRNTSGLNGA